MKHKIIYKTLWVKLSDGLDEDSAWGFEPPFIEFDQEADPAWCAEMCTRHFHEYVEGFECYGAIPHKLYISDTVFPIAKNEAEWQEWKRKYKLSEES